MAKSKCYATALGGVSGKSPLSDFYKCLVGRGKAKKLTLVAESRKILIWSWAVFVYNTPFDASRFHIS